MIDPLFQEKLMRGLREAVSYFNDGMSPTNAVTKAASAHNLNTEQATRLAETFNTARTIYHFDKNADSDNKGASFELADPAQVVLNLFGPKEQTKAAALHAYNEYDRVPMDHTLADIDISFTKKSNEMDDLRMDNQGYRIRKVLATYRTMAEDAQSKAAMADLKADQILQKLGGDISRGELFGSVDKLHRLAGAMFNKETIPVFGKLALYIPKHIAEKAYAGAQDAVVEDRDIKDWIVTVKRAQSLMEQSAEMLAISQGLEKDANDLNQQFSQLFMTGVPEKSEGSVSDFFTLGAKEAAVAPGPIVPPAPPIVPGSSVIDYNNVYRRDSNPRVQNSSGNTYNNVYRRGSNPRVQNSSGNTMGGGKGDKGGGGGEKEKGDKGGGKSTDPFAPFTVIGDAPSKLVDMATGALQSPIERGVLDIIEGDIGGENKVISDRLNNLQRTVLLEDLLSNDPVLRDADPQQVANAYRAVLQLAPNVSLNKEVVRAILRQTIHSTAISPFDANTMLGLEKTIREVSGTLPSQKKDGKK